MMKSPNSSCLILVLYFVAKSLIVIFLQLFLQPDAVDEPIWIKVGFGHVIFLNGLDQILESALSLRRVGALERGGISQLRPVVLYQSHRRSVPRLWLRPLRRNVARDGLFQAPLPALSRDGRGRTQSAHQRRAQHSSASAERHQSGLRRGFDKALAYLRRHSALGTVAPILRQLLRSPI